MDGRYVTKEEISRNHQFAKERHEEVAKYLKELIDMLDILMVKHSQANKREFALLIMWLISVWLAPFYVMIAVQFIFFGYFFHNLGGITMKKRFLQGEIAGAITVLEKLKLVPEDTDENDTPKKKIKIKKESFFEKMWAKIKRDKMDEAYA